MTIDQALKCQFSSQNQKFITPLDATPTVDSYELSLYKAVISASVLYASFDSLESTLEPSGN